MHCLRHGALIRVDLCKNLFRKILFTQKNFINNFQLLKFTVFSFSRFFPGIGKFSGFCLNRIFGAEMSKVNI